MGWTPHPIPDEFTGMAPVRRLAINETAEAPMNRSTQSRLRPNSTCFSSTVADHRNRPSRAPWTAGSPQPGKVILRRLMPSRSIPLILGVNNLRPGRHRTCVRVGS